MSIYRDMLNAFYSSVHAVQPDNMVLTGGTAPYGDPPGDKRARPLTFLRDLLCLNGKLAAKPCPSHADFDVLAQIAWGKAATAGKLVIQRKREGGWRRIASVNGKQGAVFTKKLRLTGKQKLRARVAGETSLVWAQR